MTKGGIPLRVLLLEDSEDDALLNVRELKGAGYTPQWARVETAEEMEAALAERWDVILADHNMPRFDAISALELLKAQGSDVPCIIVSGSIGEQQLLDAMQHGAEDYVLKRELSRLSSAVPRALDAANERRERRRTELLLKESEERYALALQGSRDGIWDWNLATSALYFSDRVKEILGIEEIGPAMAAFADLVHEEDRERVSQAMQAHLYRREPLEIEYRIRRGSGEHRWIFMRGQALWAEDGSPLRLAGSVSDVTARKRDEEMLRQKVAIIEAQEEAIRSLSTPVIEVWDGVLMMPVYGAIDAARAAQMMEVLLTAAARTRCRDAIIDLTSVSGVDAPTADHLLRIVRAVRLIGARGIVAGIRPEVARIMVEIGMDLEDITTQATVRDALVLCMRRNVRR